PRAPDAPIFRIAPTPIEHFQPYRAGLEGERRALWKLHSIQSIKIKNRVFRRGQLIRKKVRLTERQDPVADTVDQIETRRRLRIRRNEKQVVIEAVQLGQITIVRQALAADRHHVASERVQQRGFHLARIDVVVERIQQDQIALLDRRGQPRKRPVRAVIFFLSYLRGRQSGRIDKAQEQ